MNKDKLIVINYVVVFILQYQSEYLIAHKISCTIGKLKFKAKF